MTLIIFQYLNLLPEFGLKDKLCTEILLYLKENASNMETSVLSHQVLEVLLYQVSLNVFSGRLKIALNILQVCILVLYVL